MTDQTAGTFLRNLRIAKGLSLLDVARDTGLDPTTIRRCELISCITPRSARRLAKALGCKPADLKPRDNRGTWNRSES